MDMLLSLSGIFVAAFGAATLLPFQSEIVVGAMLLRDAAPAWLIVTVASVGNTLGSVLNWVIGRWIEHFRHRRWFPATEAQLARAQAWYGRWGIWTLLLSWAPFGDAVTVVAGIMRCPFWVFVLLVGTAKTARYVVFAWGMARLV